MLHAKLFLPFFIHHDVTKSVVSVKKKLDEKLESKDIDIKESMSQMPTMDTSKNHQPKSTTAFDIKDKIPVRSTPSPQPLLSALRMTSEYGGISCDAPPHSQQNRQLMNQVPQTVTVASSHLPAVVSQPVITQISGQQMSNVSLPVTGPSVLPPGRIAMSIGGAASVPISIAQIGQSVVSFPHTQIVVSTAVTSANTMVSQAFIVSSVSSSIPTHQSSMANMPAIQPPRCETSQSCVTLIPQLPGGMSLEVQQHQQQIPLQGHPQQTRIPQQLTLQRPPPHSRPQQMLPQQLQAMPPQAPHSMASHVPPLQSQTQVMPLQQNSIQISQQGPPPPMPGVQIHGQLPPPGHMPLGPPPPGVITSGPPMPPQNHISQAPPPPRHHLQHGPPLPGQMNQMPPGLMSQGQMMATGVARGPPPSPDPLPPQPGHLTLVSSSGHLPPSPQNIHPPPLMGPGGPPPLPAGSARQDFPMGPGAPPPLPSGSGRPDFSMGPGGPPPLPAGSARQDFSMGAPPPLPAGSGRQDFSMGPGTPRAPPPLPAGSGRPDFSMGPRTPGPGPPLPAGSGRPDFSMGPGTPSAPPPLPAGSGRQDFPIMHNMPPNLPLPASVAPNIQTPQPAECSISMGQPKPPTLFPAESSRMHQKPPLPVSMPQHHMNLPPPGVVSQPSLIQLPPHIRDNHYKNFQDQKPRAAVEPDDAYDPTEPTEQDFKGDYEIILFFLDIYMI